MLVFKMDMSLKIINYLEFKIIEENKFKGVFNYGN